MSVIVVGCRSVAVPKLELGARDHGQAVPAIGRGRSRASLDGMTRPYRNRVWKPTVAGDALSGSPDAGSGRGWHRQSGPMPGRITENVHA
jgi:hypothetical protein